jgi:hypothetical protein
MPVIIALEKLHKIPVKPWTGPILTQGNLPLLKSRHLVQVTPPQPLYRCLMESRPSYGQPGSYQRTDHCFRMADDSPKTTLWLPTTAFPDSFRFADASATSSIGLPCAVIYASDTSPSQGHADSMCNSIMLAVILFFGSRNAPAAPYWGRPTRRTRFCQRGSERRLSYIGMVNSMIRNTRC